MPTRPLLLCLSLLFPVVAVDADDGALDHSVQQLRNAIGAWAVTTEFLNEDGSVAQTQPGTYEFEWVVEDRVLQGHSHIPALDQKSGILFYIREKTGEIEMVSVGADGRLWIMTGPLGGETRYSQVFETRSGGEAQLRFTRFNVTDDRFESRMEWTEDGGASWKPGNHQVFVRQSGE